MGTSWFLDLNDFARNTPAAHGFMAYYAQEALSPLGAGLAVIALLIVSDVALARGEPRAFAGAACALAGGVATWALCLVCVPLLQEPHPYQSLAHVELLVPREGGYGLPDPRTAVAAAATAGLLLARRRRFGSAALAATLLLAFARVYVGADFPAEVAAGLGFGAAVELGVQPVAAWLLATARPRPRATVGGRPTAKARALRARPARKLTRVRPATKLAQDGGVMSARVIDALKAASEAAHYANVAAPGPPQEPGEQVR